jgi:hypothetical protein
MPKYCPDEIYQHLESMSRGPFRAALARILGCAPSNEAIQAQAERYPDRWGQLTAILARLSGFNEKLEIEGSLNQQVTQMSDAQLLDRLSKLEKQLEDRQSNSDSVYPPKNQELS